MSLTPLTPVAPIPCPPPPPAAPQESAPLAHILAFQAMNGRLPSELKFRESTAQ